MIRELLSENILHDLLQLTSLSPIRIGLDTFISAKCVKLRTYLYKAPALCSDDQYDHLSIAFLQPKHQKQSLIRYQLSGPFANSGIRDNRPGVGV